VYEPYASFLTLCAYLLKGYLYSPSFLVHSFSETHGSKLVGGRLNCLSGVTISALIHSATRVFVWLVARIRCKQAQVVAAELPENLSCVAYRPATQNTTQD